MTSGEPVAPGLPPRLVDWIAGAMGSPPQQTLFEAQQLTHVFGVRLRDKREVVVKARPGIERAQRCVAAQRALHGDGFACPEPLTEVADVAGLAVHAEALVAGGEQLEGTSPDIVDRFAALFADLADRLARIDPLPPESGPVWLTWDRPELAVAPLDGEGVLPPAWLSDLTARVRARLLAARFPDVVGHGDWETQNMRWRGDRIHVVHDWDSLTARPKAALVGAAAATFASDRQPTLAPIDASERFVSTYERGRGRVFIPEEREVAWATGLWLAARNARVELADARPPLVLDALAREGAERLTRAGA